MPMPTMNILNGGRHANNGLSIQEFMIVPTGKSMSERVRVGSEVFHALANLLNKKGFNIGVGDEGGFAPQLPNNEQAVKLIMQAIKDAGYIPGKQVCLAMDFASSEFYRHGKYYFENAREAWNSDKIIELVQLWVHRYPIISVEDALAEDDWAAWEKITKRIGGDVTLVGDDLFVTNTKRIQMGIEQNVANAVLIKLNQIGSLSETIDAIYLAKKT
jgi:enolase